MLGLILFIPLIIYQNLVLPVHILPSAQALGIWGRVIQFFSFLWLLFDVGTSAAFIKFWVSGSLHGGYSGILNLFGFFACCPQQVGESNTLTRRNPKEP